MHTKLIKIKEKIWATQCLHINEQDAWIIFLKQSKRCRTFCSISNNNKYLLRL